MSESQSISKAELSLAAKIEAMLFVSAEPVPLAQLSQALDVTASVVERGLKELEDALPSRGLRLQRNAGRVQLTTQKLAYGRRRVDDEDAVSTFVDDSVDVAADLERKQGLELLEAILDAMPLEQRAVFTLFELEGLTGEAIAEALEIPLGTTYSRLRLAREAFQRAVTRLRARDDRRGPLPPPRPSGIQPTARARAGEVPEDAQRIALGGAR